MTFKKFLLSVIGGVTLLTIGQQVQADTYNVPMQVLENGTNSASYASAYFASSATVSTNGDQYTVTSTVSTDTSLGNYPVQILSVDGGGVSTSRSQAGNTQTLTYSFVTSNLAARHNTAIKVDVNSINYHHNYIVGLVLDTSAIPAPAAKTTTVAQSSQAPTVKASDKQDVAQSTSTDTAPTSATQNTAIATAVSSNASTANVTSSSAEDISTDTHSATSSTAKDGSSNSAKHSSTTLKSHQQSTASKQIHQPKTNSDLPVIPIVGGGVLVGILAALALAFFKRP